VNRTPHAGTDVVPSPGTAAAAPAELVERFLALQPRIERALDLGLPTELRRELGSVTAHQLEALGQLPATGQTMRRFAAAVGISGAAATALVDRMVAQGLVERLPDPQDRRTVWVAPSERARGMLMSYQAWRRAMMASVLRRLDVGQIAALVELLDTLTGSEEESPPAASASLRITPPSAQSSRRDADDGS